MKKIFILLLLNFLLILCGNTVNASEISNLNAIDKELSFKNNQIILNMKNDDKAINTTYTKDDFKEVDCIDVKDLGFSSPKESTTKNNKILLLTLKENSKEKVIDYINLLNEREDVEKAEPNYVSKIEDLNVTSNERSTVSNTWALDMIDFYEAYSLLPVLSGNTKVAIIDSGIQTNNSSLHSELSGKINTNYMFDCTNGTASFSTNQTDNDNYPYGHATPIAGIVGAVNNGNSTEGICPNVLLSSFKVDTSFSQGTSTEVMVSDVVVAFNKINEGNPTEVIKVVNLSLGFDGYSTALYNAISNFSGLVVCAAGNRNKNIDTNPMYPASFTLNNIITVGAINNNNQIWSDTSTSGSNFGSNSVDVFAPGELVYSITAQGGYYLFTGTSYAAPFVTGLAALLFSINPNLSVSAVKQTIINTVVSNSGLTGKCVSGGVINVLNAVSAIHTHEMNIYNYYNATYHTKECACGYNVLEEHTFRNIVYNYIPLAARPRQCIYCGLSVL